MVTYWSSVRPCAVVSEARKGEIIVRSKIIAVTRLSNDSNLSIIKFKAVFIHVDLIKVFLSLSTFNFKDLE